MILILIKKMFSNKKVNIVTYKNTLKQEIKKRMNQ